MKKTEIAWAAGLFEGEGTVCAIKLHYKRKDGTQLKSPVLALRMTDEQTVRRIAGLFGAGCVLIEPKKNPKHNTTWRWHVGGRTSVERIFKDISPWLSDRRIAQFERVFAAHDASIQKPQFAPKKWRRT